MMPFSRLLPFLALCALFLVPFAVPMGMSFIGNTSAGGSLLAASAAPDLLNGLVPACGTRSPEVKNPDGSTTVTYTPCDTCHLVELIKNVIDFIAKYVTVAGGALMLMIGGFQMVTGGLGGSSTAYQKGWHTIRNAFIGLAIILISWLAVDTVIKLLVGTNMNSVLSGEPGRIFPVSQVQTGFGPWNAINCTKLDPVPVTTKPLPKSASGQTVAQAYGEGCVCRGTSPQAGTGACAGIGDVCAQVIKENMENNARNPEGTALREPLGVGCVAGSLAPYREAINVAAGEAGMDPKRFAALLQVESSGKWWEVSGKGAVGLGQVLPTTARDTLKIPELQGKDNGQVTAWLKNGENNIHASALYLQHLGRLPQLRGDRALIEAAYNAGPGPDAMGPSVHCKGRVMKWQCPYDSFNAKGESCYDAGPEGCKKNTGFEQTRQYSQKINAAQQSIISGSCKATEPAP